MRALEPSRLAAAVFVLLVGATIGAFFAAQQLKHQAPLLRYRASDRAFMIAPLDGKQACCTDG